MGYEWQSVNPSQGDVRDDDDGFYEVDVNTMEGLVTQSDSNPGDLNPGHALGIHIEPILNVSAGAAIVLTCTACFASVYMMQMVKLGSLTRDRYEV